MGLHVAKMTSAWIYGPQVQGLPSAVNQTEGGHAYGPIHFFAVAVALSQMGQYPGFANKWLPTLASRQKEDGSVHTLNDGGKDGEAQFTSGHRVGSTAVFALMILLQKNKLIDNSTKKPASAGAPSASNAFSRKTPKPAHKGETTAGAGPAGMIPPYIPEVPPEPMDKPITGGGSQEEGPK
jgi:hypothetical protein